MPHKKFYDLLNYVEVKLPSKHVQNFINAKELYRSGARLKPRTKK